MSAVTMPFNDWLGSRSAHQLETLVTARPDLLHPRPRDVPGLAARAASQASAARARTFLDAPADVVLEAALTLAPHSLIATPTSLADRTGYSPENVTRIANRLVDRALLWPALSADGGEDLGGWRVQPVLAPLGAVEGAEDATEAPPLTPPDPVTVPFPDERAEGFAAGNAAETLGQVGALLDQLDDAPVQGLRQGGISSRAAGALARATHMSVSDLAAVAELALAAGLVGTGADPADPGGARLWLPTARADDFRDRAPVEQWAALVDAWQECARLPAGDADHPGRLLSSGAERTALPGLRRTVLAMLTGSAPGTGEALTSLDSRLLYARPRMWARWAPLVDAVLTSGAKLGVLALSLRNDAVRLSRVGTGLLEDPERAAALMEPLLPEPTTEVVLESDLTAVVPGVAHPQVRRFLRRLAVVEAGGQGTVFRFTPASVLAGLESGLDPRDVLNRLAHLSAAPVPQALEYLVLDAARTLGRVALGRAAAYVRADDAEQIDALLAQAQQGRLPGVALERLAPTVAVTTAPLSLLAKSLADLGIAAHAEESGQRIHGDTRPLRADQPTGAASSGGVAQATPREVRALTEKWAEDARRRRERRGSSPAGRAASGGPADTPAGIVEVLTEAAASRRTVRATVVDRHGEPFTMELSPRSVVGGRVRGIRLDAEQEAEVTVVVHRIARAELL